MQRILNYIETALDSDITPAELADRAGYSLWHFLHLFQQEVGMPLKRYTVRRRLAHAMWHISQGAAVTDAALRWGFDTHSGFYRACQKEYGMSPTAYIRTHRINAPSVPLLKEEVFKMLTRERFRDALRHWCNLFPDPDAVALTPVTYPDAGHVSENAMYAGPGHILKAYRDEHSCRMAIAMADALHQQGIAASRALPLPDGSRSLPFHGLWITLCSRIVGHPLRATELLSTPEHSGWRIGMALARLHKATNAIADLPYADDEPFADHLLNWAIPRTLAALPGCLPDGYPQAVQQLRHLPTALVHRDPNPSNLIDTGDALGFIDFDLSCRCVRLFDPCYTATAVLSETFERADVPWETAWPIFCRAMLAGYHSICPLTEAEWQSVPTLLIGNELLCLAAFADSSKYRDVFETNRRMLPWLIAHTGNICCTMA